MHRKVVVIGASSNPERYSHKAMNALLEKGFDAVPVHPREETVCGKPVVPSLDQVELPVDTVTVYVRPAIFQDMVDDVISLSPQRIIFNPGTENPQAAAVLRDAGIEVIEACTLVMLSTGQFP